MLLAFGKSDCLRTAHTLVELKSSCKHEPALDCLLRSYSSAPRLFRTPFLNAVLVGRKMSSSGARKCRRYADPDPLSPWIYRSLRQMPQRRRNMISVSRGAAVRESQSSPSAARAHGVRATNRHRVDCLSCASPHCGTRNRSRLRGDGRSGRI